MDLERLEGKLAVVGHGGSLPGILVAGA
jgi:hypothetical protein